MLKLYVMDNTSGNVHEYGTNPHDSLILQDDGSLHYHNLQNGCGTLCPEEGYSFCLEDGSNPYSVETGESIVDIGGCGIVPCKLCKHYRHYNDQDDLCLYRNIQVEPDDFCSRAKRKSIWEQESFLEMIDNGPDTGTECCNTLYAHDLNDTYTPAKDAEKGKTYKCPICGCLMHVTTTKLGNKIFARNPDQEHVDFRCKTLESKRVEKTFDSLDPDKFISSLCHVVPRKGDQIDIFPRIKDNDEDTPKMPDANDNDKRLSAFSSLKQIAKSGIPSLKAHDKQGSHYVSDFIMTYKFGEEFFSNPSFILGSRIVYARLSWIDFKRHAVVFSMFTPNISVKFRLMFLNFKDFKAIRDKLGEYEKDDKDKTVFKYFNKNQEALIASDDWSFIGRSQCNTLCSSNENFCSSCKGMYQAIFTNTKQLYFIPMES